MDECRVRVPYTVLIVGSCIFKFCVIIDVKNMGYNLLLCTFTARCKINAAA